MRKQVIKLLALIIMCFVLMGPLLSQTAKYRKAALYMEALRYDDAISVYEKLYRRDENAFDALLGLAKAYRKMDMLEEASRWYAKALALPEVSPIAFYDYGHILFQMGECVAAQSAFDEFLRRKPYDERAAKLEDVCSYYNSLKEGNSLQTQVSLPNFNGTYSDLAPAFFEDGIVFGSVRNSEKRKDAYYDLYFTKPIAEDRPEGLSLSYQEVVGFSDMLNGTFNEAIVTFNPDFSEVYFTRNQEVAVVEKRPILRLEIMVSRQGADGSWSSPTPLDFNNKAYSTAHPALSPDGRRLFFTSDRPGGFGGKDIYYCDRLGLGWSSPINLGPKINTEGDELYPYFQQGGELYFASDGQLGLGGLDIFRVEELGGGDWGGVENLSVPINSTADDFALILRPDQSYGFFTSNREGGIGGDDIYAFQKRRIKLNLQFALEDSTANPGAVPFALRTEEFLQFSSEDGSWNSWLDPDECIYLNVQDERYEAAAMEICATDAGAEDLLEVKLVLQPATETASFADKGSNAQLIGQISDELTGEPVAFAEVMLNGTSCAASIRLTADKDGRFSYGTEEECCFEITVAADGYFVSPANNILCSKDWPYEFFLSLSPYRLKENQDLQSNQSVTEETFQVGTTVYNDADRAIPYLLNVYYDLGRASVRVEAIAELNRLYWLLVRNPEIVVEVGSHTDSRGTDAFNERLSQRRATAIVNWLIKKGIKRERLLAKGYGETRLVNACSNGVECDEEDHQMNRRTEFRVLEAQIGQSN